jgi:hypothetical protein
LAQLVSLREVVASDPLKIGDRTPAAPMPIAALHMV